MIANVNPAIDQMGSCPVPSVGRPSSIQVEFVSCCSSLLRLFSNDNRNRLLTTSFGKFAVWREAVLTKDVNNFEHCFTPGLGPTVLQGGVRPLY